MIDRLADAEDYQPAEKFAGPDHPMRIITREIALEGIWNAEIRQRISSTFDSLAPGWSEDHVDPVKAAPVRDALERSDLRLGSARWLELGSGTGAGGKVVAAEVAEYVAFDLSAGMIAADASEHAYQVRGDASVLPFADDSFDVVMAINMFLFPAEVNRVLAPAGRFLWVNTMGDQTPIHLPVSDVISALPGEWSATTAAAGTGFWATFRRGQRLQR